MSNQWNTYSDLYNQGIGNEGDELHQELIDPIIFNFLDDYQNKTILDLGCGNGYLTNKLAKKAKKVIGMDFAEKLLLHAKKNFSADNIEFIQADATQKLPLADNESEVMIVNMVAQYLPELKNLVKEAHRILKKNGQAIVIVDHPAHSLFLRAQKLIGKNDKKFIDLNSYFQVEKRRKKSLWNKAVLEYYHRPISYYVNSFANNFHLVEMREATQDREIPRILGLNWKKL